MVLASESYCCKLWSFMSHDVKSMFTADNGAGGTGGIRGSIDGAAIGSGNITGTGSGAITCGIGVVLKHDNTAAVGWR
jgi:hypothetical protein